MPETIHIGGGDDWMPVPIVERDHPPSAPNAIGMFPTCDTCGGNLIFTGFTGPRSNRTETYAHTGRTP